MKKMLGCHADERGFVLIAALLILVLVTIIGIAAISTSTSERQTATNFLLYERAFYVAEAGLEHAKEDLLRALGSQTPNSAGAYQNGLYIPTWTKVLDGTGEKAKATGTSYAGGVKWFDKKSFDGHTYTVTVWDNVDEIAPIPLDPASDSDGLVWIRSEAFGPEARNAKCSIEALVEIKKKGTGASGVFGGYAQAVGGSEKNSTSDDVASVDLTAGQKALNTGG